MQRTLFALSFCLLAGNVLAQGAGAPSAGAAATPGAAPPSAPTARSTPGAPAPGNPSPPVATDVSPPSRLLQTPAPGSGPPASSGAAATNPSGAAASPGAPTAPDPNLPATASGGRPQAGGANALQPSTRTGKNPISERYADCVRLWDSHTHMSKPEWSRTCRRVENRLQNLRVDNLNIDVSGPKPRKSEKATGGSG